jgi:hypothetical protein
VSEEVFGPNGNNGIAGTSEMTHNRDPPAPQSFFYLRRTSTRMMTSIAMMMASSEADTTTISIAPKLTLEIQ